MSGFGGAMRGFRLAVYRHLLAGLRGAWGSFGIAGAGFGLGLRGFFFQRNRGAVARDRWSGSGRGVSGIVAPQSIGHIVVDRAGMGHLLGNAEFVELVDDLARLYFQLPRQLINPDLTHI
jgi:hypothetical protein